MSVFRHRRATSDAGIGLIEIVVSMFLLALLAMAFLPLIVQSMRTSVDTGRVATASQLLSQELDLLRAVEPYCVDVGAFDDSQPGPITDAQGRVYQAERTVGTCPASYPDTVRVTVTVTEGSDPDPSAEAATLVYLKGSSAPTPTPTPTP